MHIKKISKIISKVLLIIIFIVILLVSLGLGYHNIYLKHKLNKIKPYGQMIEIDGGKLHVYVEGEGDKTIVLLPGHGVALPSADFGPLIKELKKDYKVAVVEYFGVGFSDGTKNPRDNENFINEIREGLKGAGVKPPYILMPHSISGLYSEQYAKTYSNEVEGLFFLDTTIATEGYLNFVNENIKAFKLTSLARLSQLIGMQDIMIKIKSDEELKDVGFIYSKELGYTEKEIEDLKKYITFNLTQDSLEQLYNLSDAVKEVIEMKGEIDIPVYKIISEENPLIEESIKSVKNLGKDNRYEIIDNGHFVYHGREKHIKKTLDKFIMDNF